MWEYLYGFASKERPSQVSFFDKGNARLYRDVDLSTMGAHGWELLAVVPGAADNGDERYEYWFKRPKVSDGSDPPNMQ